MTASITNTSCYDDQLWLWRLIHAKEEMMIYICMPFWSPFTIWVSSLHVFIPRIGLKQQYTLWQKIRSKCCITGNYIIIASTNGRGDVFSKSEAKYWLMCLCGFTKPLRIQIKDEMKQQGGNEPSSAIKKQLCDGNYKTKSKSKDVVKLLYCI